MESLYLITCNSSNYSYITSLLEEKYIISKMNNYDDTFDYIIKCDEEYSSLLKSKGIHIVADRKIVYKI